MKVIIIASRRFQFGRLYKLIFLTVKLDGLTYISVLFSLDVLSNIWRDKPFDILSLLSIANTLSRVLLKL